MIRRRERRDQSNKLVSHILLDRFQQASTVLCNMNNGIIHLVNDPIPINFWKSMLNLLHKISNILRHQKPKYANIFPVFSRKPQIKYS